MSADGTQISIKRYEKTANKGAESGYIERTSVNYDVPAKTQYIRFWYCNAGSGDARKSVRNMQAYLVQPHIDHTGWTKWSGSKSETTLSTEANIVLTGKTNFSGNLVISNGATVNLCLNGNVLNLNGHYFEVSQQSVLNIFDCNSAGKSHKFTVDSDGLWKLNDSATSSYKVLDGGAITGGSSSGGGGGVRVFSGTLNLYGGNIVGNTSTFDGGGGVCVGYTSTFNMYGGSIIGNKSTGNMNYSNGVDVYSGTMNMYGGIISDNTGSDCGGIYLCNKEYGLRTGVLRMYGGTISDADMAIYNRGGDFGAATGYVLYGSTEKNGTPTIKITDTSDLSQYKLITVKKLHTHTGVTDDFTYLSDWSQLSISGNYYLGETIPEVTDNISIAKDKKITICLNGKTLDIGSNYIDVKDKAEFNICDCQSSQGKITSTHSYQTIFNRATGSVTVSGGTVTNTNGGGIRNYSTGSVAVLGGCVSSANSYGIYNYDYGTVSVSDGTVDGADYGINGSKGSIYLSGRPTVSGGTASVYKSTSAILYAQSAEATPTAYSGGELSVYAHEALVGEVIVNNVTDSNKGEFSVTNEGYILKQDGNNLVLAEKITHTHTDVEGEFTEWTATGGKFASGNYYLVNDMTATGDMSVQQGETVILCLNGNTLSMGEYHITNYGTLTICDCGVGGTITADLHVIHNSRSSAKITVWGGVLTSRDGSGIYNSGIVEVKGGTVTSESTSGNYISGIYNTGGNVTVSGGNVSGKYGVFNTTDSQVTVSGGKVYSTGSSAVSYGVYNHYTATVTVLGGKVEGYYGIYNQSTNENAVVVSGGTVTGTNSAGIYHSKAGTVTVSGGTVQSTGTLATAYGIYNDGDGTIEVSGGNVSGMPEIISTVNYGVKNCGSLYLSGAPTISGDETSHADILAEGGSIYAESSNAEPLEYSGNEITVHVQAPTENKVVIYNITDLNKESFRLINTAGYFLTRSGNNLILSLAHTHSFEYSVSGDGKTITATCVGEGTCDYSGTDLTLTIITPEMITYGDGKSANATLSASSIAGITTLPDIKYVGRNNTVYAESTTAPTAVGQYTAMLTIGGKTISVDYKIESVAPTYTVTIPATVELGETVTVKAENISVGEDKEVHIKLTATSGKNNAFTLTNSSNNETVEYKISKGETNINIGDTVLLLNSNSSEAASVELTFKKPEAVVSYGTYTGTITFTVSTAQVQGWEE